MNEQQILEYINELPIDRDSRPSAFEKDETEPTVDVSNLSDKVLSGGNLIAFDGDVAPDLRSAVSLSILAAQRVASNDEVIVEPDQWLERHNTVLKNLNWTLETTGTLTKEFESVDANVHKAIIPFLTAALGGAAVSATNLITTALEQLNEMDKEAPWITLFHKQSRRFNISEYHFTTVAVAEDKVVLSLAATRFDAKYGTKQILFFKLSEQKSKFEIASSRFAAHKNLLSMTNEALVEKLKASVNQFIVDLDID